MLAGEVKLRYEFEPSGKPDLAKGKGSPGKARLYIGDKLVGETEFTGTIKEVSIDVSRKLQVDSKEQEAALAKVAMARQ